MNEVVTLSNILVQTHDDIALEALWIDDDNYQPDLVIYCSSGELEMLTQPKISQWVVATQQKYAQAQHLCISMACTSLHASILEFSNSDATSALVIVLETPKNYLQTLLNRALGEDDSDIIVNECVGRVTLQKMPQSDVQQSDIVVNACSILAKPKGIMGDALMVNQLREWIDKHSDEHQKSHFVSFQVKSVWSDQLLMGFQKWIGDSEKIGNILPSFECDENHWLAVKPLFEILKYQDQLQNNNMIISTLGGGGRLGGLKLQSGASQASTNLSEGEPIYLDNVSPHMHHIIQRDDRPRYCEIEHRRSNAYFYSNVLAE